ncbi:peptide chain release factor N(5)-glutamine methyltransferase [Mycolicibacillus parakoreensis]|nr:peptide chain release factor N(5)-glutamine methyltransferase [Mycolicibacillus parakoreensis]
MTRCGVPTRRSPGGLSRAIAEAAAALAHAGIDSARRDAEELAAHLIGTERGRLALVDPPVRTFYAEYRRLVDARARRVPLQHLTGTASFGSVTLHVGPGVFVPRPETEALLAWALAEDLPDSPTVIDACTGSGALALALARHRPTARVFGIEICESALAYARRNGADSPVQWVQADIATPGLLAELDGAVDLVVANPPYLPEGASLTPEVADHDPRHALFAGSDGMAVIGAVTARAGSWLRPGGRFAVEHDDSTAGATVELIAHTGLFDTIVSRRDLAGRPRFVTARRKVSR